MNSDGPAATTAAVERSGGILTVDLGAIAANWRDLKSRAAPARCAAVVKADGYGLGLTPVADALARAGCDTFFVALLSEGIRLRAALPTVAIYVLNGLTPNTAAEFRKHRLEPVLGSWPEIDEWDSFAASCGEPLPAAVHVDTGMQRHGLTPEEAILLSERMLLLHFRPSLVMSHFACADEPSHPLNAVQTSAFQSIAAKYPGIPASLANSAGILGQRDAMFDLVRPGISLFGGRALLSEDNPMRPTVRLDIRIVQVRQARAGETVGYGAAQRLARDSRIAVCSAGYADGIHRIVGSTDTHRGAEAIVAGKRCPFAGRISMDLFALDVTDLPEDAVKRGDYAALLGEEIGVDELAAHAGTIGYEMLTALGRRYARIYRGA